MPTKKKLKPEIIKPGHPEYLQPATKEVFNMMDKGLTAEEATKLVKNKDKLSSSAKTKIKKSYDRYSLTKPKLVRLANKAIEDTLAMTEHVSSDGNISIPSFTNRLTAAAMVKDRSEPVVRQNMNVNVNADIDPVDLSAYLNRGE